MKLASLVYLQVVKKRSNADPEYLELAEGHNASYTLVLEPEPEKGVAEQIVVGFDNVDGRMNEMWLEQRPTQFTLSAPYGVWVDILRGKMGPTKAIASRKLRTQGPFVQLLQGANRIIRWVEVLRTIPTEFEGDYAQYSLPGEPE
jgi:putative sterol carrier protein